MLVQDYSMHEYREQDKLSSDTSSLSVDQYNLISSLSASGGDSQSAASIDPQTDQLESAGDTPEVTLRKPKAQSDFGWLHSRYNVSVIDLILLLLL